VSSWTTEDARTVREMIFKEAELINHRFTWLATLQGLLFTALAFGWKDFRGLVYLLAGLGVAASGSSLAVLWCSQEAIKKLARDWERNKPPGYTGPGVMGFIPMIPYFDLVLPWLALPVLFAAAWVTVLVMAMVAA